ncbi:uncharacterized protein LOC142976653 [Anticarsia gemmatalis]|uniref:uncharacterized protein LOC142976653 n=1 Tax=Anticarsia gemmatalis TaxID=129554 RepID=UPI003F76325B
MSRVVSFVLFLAVAQCVVCSLVALPAKEEENNVVLPEGAGEPMPVVQMLAAKNLGCAQIGERCINHSDCCSNACHGYLKKCVT